MAIEAVAGFWSYAHADNKASRGEILQFAEEIGDEFDLMTGRELCIFVDRDDIAWGDNWRERIDTGLKGTTFFMPIITPRYFVREECRRELRLFTSQAKSLGLIEFLLPILYVPTAALT